MRELKISPNSDAEKRFIQLLKQVGVKPDNVLCRLGSVFHTPYNEYLISEGLYRQIREELEKIKGI